MQAQDSAAAPEALSAATLATDGLVLGARGTRVLLAASAILSVGILVLLALSDDPSPWVTSNQATYAFLGVALLSAVLTLSGQVRAATQVFQWGILLLMTLNAALVQGVRTPGLLVSLPMLVLLSGWLTGLRNAMLFGVFSIVQVLLLWAAESFGWLTFHTQRPTANYAIVMVIGILVTMAVTYGSLTGFLSQMRQIGGLTDALRRRVAEVERSEARFAALFRGTPLPSVSVDQAGVIVDANDAWLSTFGFERAQVVGRTAKELHLWTDPAQRQVFYAHYYRAGHASPFAAHLQSPTRPSTPYLLFTSEVQYENERRFVISLLDQSDRIAAEQAQRATQEQLEARVAARTQELQRTVEQLTQAQDTLVRSEKLASLGALVAGVSHELNTPLGNALTVATSMQHQVGQVRNTVEANQIKRSELLAFFGQLDEMAEMVSRNTQRAADLVSSFKQVAVDRTSQRLRAFDLQLLVDDILASMRPALRHLKLDIHNDVPPGIDCHSYPGALGQIVTNLLQNCAVHAFADRTAGRIDIRARSEGGWVELQVQDDGAGMSSEVLARAFDPFFTTRLGQGGSGLGLSVSHSLATSVLGGQLSATSTPGQGSCFTLRMARHVTPAAGSEETVA